MTDHVPAGRFTSQALWEAERERLWPRTWLLAGRADEVSGPGQYFTWERTGIPLIVVGSIDGTIRAFYNSCRHRGAPVVREARGRSRALRCQYHSWTYDTTGRLVSVPDERDFVDLRLDERSLVPARCEVVDGWIFVTEAPEAAPPSAALGPAAGALAGYRDFMALHRVTFRVGGNWKLAAERLAGWLAGVAGEGTQLKRVLAVRRPGKRADRRIRPFGRDVVAPLQREKRHRCDPSVGMAGELHDGVHRRRIVGERVDARLARRL